MSLLTKLRQEKRTNEEFEVMLKHLTLEEVLFLRLELENESLKNSLYGYKIYNIIREIVSEGLIRFALDIKKTKQSASRFLGIDINSFEYNMIKYKIPKARNTTKQVLTKNKI